MDERKTGYENLTNLELRLEDGEDPDVRREVVDRGYDFKSFFNRPISEFYTKGLKVRGTLNVDNSQLSKK